MPSVDQTSHVVMNLITHISNKNSTFFSLAHFLSSFSLQTGDKIRVTSRIDADWIMGKFGGLEGMFPEVFVDSVPDDVPQEAEESSSIKGEDKVRGSS